jgi:hypothetical protein
MKKKELSKVKKLFILLLLWVPIACVFLDPQHWSEERGPVVPHDSFPADCALCHVGNGWHEIRSDFRFDHKKETGVELKGQHKKAECLLCHNDRGKVQVFVGRGCSGCHADPHAAQLGKSCKACHDERSWEPRGQIGKHARTRFPLAGIHASAACHRCHPGANVGRFGGLSSDCQTCHSKELARAKDPDHIAQGWTDACQRCHLPTAWGDARFEHNSFPLIGQHKTIHCAECHKGNVFKGTPKKCVECHLKDYTATSEPKHVAAGFGMDCERCHSPYGWSGSNFDHNPFFALQGGHGGLECSACHKGIYRGTPKDCSSCHLKDYNRTTSPNHKAAAFPTTCELCHSTYDWNGSNFDHNRTFALRGSHKGLVCSKCHKGGVYKGTPRDCSTCHIKDYTNTSNPNHQAAGFPLSCETCHNETTWKGAKFDHDKFFKLLGSHKGMDCSKCHAGGRYKGTPRDCATCHLKDYNKTTNPNHKSAGFPTSCDLCHNQSSWKGATFDHNKYFVLKGSHKGLACSKCHPGGRYRGTPKDCATCHIQDYNKTTSPNHKVSGFPTKCEICHNETTWKGATFDHRAFPINSGKHKGLSCTDCHPKLSQPKVFTCLSCHEHSKTKMDKKHKKISGYRYLSSACYSCHPKGKE